MARESDPGSPWMHERQRANPLLFCSSLVLCFPLSFHQAADGDLMEAVTFLTEDPTPEPVQKPAAAEPSAWEGSVVGKQLPQGELHLCSPLQLPVFV